MKITDRDIENIEWVMDQSLMMAEILRLGKRGKQRRKENKIIDKEIEIIGWVMEKKLMMEEIWRLR